MRPGLLGAGLQAYWPQFHGLRERPEGCVDLGQQRLGAPDRQIINFGLLDSPHHNLNFAHRCRAAYFHRLRVYVTIYSLSPVLLPSCPATASAGKSTAQTHPELAC